MKNYSLTYQNSIKWAVIGMVGLTAFYFLVSSLIGRSLTHPFEQFAALQPWITILILSFGLQVGLFKLVRSHPRVVGATGGVSGASMVACCLHHASDLLPILGASTLSSILTVYQKDFLILGVVINLFAIFYLLKFLPFQRVRIFRYSFLTIAVVIAIFGVFSFAKSTPAQENVFGPQTKQMGVVEVEVVPKWLERGQNVTFTINLNNHLIDLNYDFMKIAVLVDSEGNVYTPVGFSGEGSGHHVSGDLEFGKLSSKADSVGLNIKGIDNQNTVFEWKL